MGVYSLRVPRILWGASLDKAVDCGYPLDNVQVGSQPRDGSSWVQSPSGAEDAWIIGTDHVIEGDYRYIPTDDILDGARKLTGWDSNTPTARVGVREWLEYARQKNAFRFYPDGRNIVALNPSMSVDTNTDGVVDEWTPTTPTSGTLSFDGTDLAQVIAVVGGGNTSGVAQFAQVNQLIRAILPGESLVGSVEVKCTGLANGVLGYIEVFFFDAVGAAIGGSFATTTTSTVYTRISVGPLTAPANTVYARLGCVVQIPANTGTLSAGSVRFRKAMMRRGGDTDTTFVDANWLSLTLVEPMQGTPSFERDGTRQVHLRLRGASAITGY